MIQSDNITLYLASTKRNNMVITTENISQAAAILREGGLVAFPTETVYGLGLMQPMKRPSAIFPSERTSLRSPINRSLR